jgi:hypothetical protein
MGNRKAKVCITVQTSTFSVSSMECADFFRSETKAQEKILDASPAWGLSISQLFFLVLGFDLAVIGFLVKRNPMVLGINKYPDTGFS